MITIRHAAARGATRLAWLDSRHTFSFTDYFDPQHMGFGALRVINEDRVAPGAGFSTHGHRDMEIITYVLEGALAHKDSLGTGAVIRPGEIQRMTAGTGILHSEFNASASEPVHFLQVWLLPERSGLEPGYEQKATAEADRRGGLRLVCARDGRDGAVRIHQDADLYTSLLAPGEVVRHRLRPGRRAWIQIAHGEVEANGARLAAGDGAALEAGPTLELRALSAAEVLLFDLA
jgi:redox-sensitive bicupin YhaK (pirin superfamily)